MMSFESHNPIIGRESCCSLTHLSLLKKSVIITKGVFLKMGAPFLFMNLAL